MSLDSNEIIKLYNEGLSPYEIAEKYNTYPNKVKRLLQKSGIELRNRGAAQSIAMKSGRKKHPSKGKKMTETQRIALGRRVAKQWKELSEQELERRRQIGKETWNKIPIQTKIEMREKAFDALRQTSEEGSRAEKVLKRELTKQGFHVHSHKKRLIPDEKLEVDMFIPELNTCIEIDGKSHFEPIWGQEKLEKQVKADTHKAGLLLSHGYALVRVKMLAQRFGLTHANTMVTEVIKTLKEIQTQFPDKDKRYIEIEVS